MVAIHTGVFEGFSTGSERKRSMANCAKRGAVQFGLALSAVFLIGGSSSLAQPVFPASDVPAGYLVFPKVVVSTTADTFIQLTNTNRATPGSPPIARTVQCFYIDSTTCGESSNFTIELSPGQPTAWTVHDGAPSLGIGGRGDFLGELKCVEVDGITTVVPVTVNDLKGEASIYTVTGGNPGSVDVRSYNAIGLQAIAPASSSATPTSIGKKCLFGAHPGVGCVDDTPCLPGGECGVTMCLGQTAGSPECGTANYVSCPNTLILNNFFDQALDPVSGKAITTNLTLVPCTEDLAQGTVEAQPITSVQFLIFNEFEQRTSTATKVQCFKEVQLSRIDAKPGAELASVFNVGVQGTLVGQTRIRPVQVATDTTVGHGLLGVAEEFHVTGSVAVNLNQVGTNQGRGDFVHYILALP